MDENQAWADFSTKVEEDRQSIEDLRKSSASMVDMINIMNKTVNDMSAKLNRTVAMADRVMGEDSIIDNLSSEPPMGNPFDPAYGATPASDPVENGAPSETAVPEGGMTTDLQSSDGAGLDGSMMEEPIGAEDGEEGVDGEGPEDDYVEYPDLPSELESYLDSLDDSDRAVMEKAIAIVRKVDGGDEDTEGSPGTEEDGTGEDPGAEGGGSDEGSDKDFPPSDGKDDQDGGKDKDKEDDSSDKPKEDDSEDGKKDKEGKDMTDDIKKSTETEMIGTEGAEDLNKSTDEGQISGQAMPDPTPAPPAPAPETTPNLPDPTPGEPKAAPAPSSAPAPAPQAKVTVEPTPKAPSGEDTSFDDEYNAFMARKNGTRWC